MDTAVLEAAEASASALRACYNVILRHAASGDARPLPTERADPGPGARDAPPAAGVLHAIEPPSAFRNDAESRHGPARMSPSLATVMLPAHTPDDDAPAAAMTGGAGDAFEAFVRDHRAMLVAYLGRRIGEDDAQDIAQETMVRLMRYRAQPVEQLRPLMYRIAINVIHDRGRRDATRQVFAHVSLDQDFVGLASLEPAHDQRIGHEQELALARAAILQLPERCRQVYLLNRIEGMSYSQIAQHCGISVKAVEKHIGKALGILRARLKEGGMDREDRS